MNEILNRAGVINAVVLVAIGVRHPLWNHLVLHRGVLFSPDLVVTHAHKVPPEHMVPGETFEVFLAGYERAYLQTGGSLWRLQTMPQLLASSEPIRASVLCSSPPERHDFILLKFEERLLPPDLRPLEIAPSVSESLFVVLLEGEQDFLPASPDTAEGDAPYLIPIRTPGRQFHEGESGSAVVNTDGQLVGIVTDSVPGERALISPAWAWKC